MSSAVHVRDSYRNWNCSRARLKLLKIALKAGPPTSVRMALWRGWLHFKMLQTMRRRTLMLRLNGPQSNGRRYASLHPATHGIRVNSAIMEMISLKIMMRKTIWDLWELLLFETPEGCPWAVNNYHSGERHGLEKKTYKSMITLVRGGTSNHTCKTPLEAGPLPPLPTPPPLHRERHSWRWFRVKARTKSHHLCWHQSLDC